MVVFWIVNVVYAESKIRSRSSFQLMQVLAHKLKLFLVNFSLITCADANKYYLIITLCSCFFLQSNHSTKLSLDWIAGVAAVILLVDFNKDYRFIVNADSVRKQPYAKEYLVQHIKLVAILFELIDYHVFYLAGQSCFGEIKVDLFQLIISVIFQNTFCLRNFLAAVPVNDCPFTRSLFSGKVYVAPLMIASYLGDHKAVEIIIGSIGSRSKNVLLKKTNQGDDCQGDDCLTLAKEALDIAQLLYDEAREYEVKAATQSERKRREKIVVKHAEKLEMAVELVRRLDSMKSSVSALAGLSISL